MRTSFGTRITLLLLLALLATTCGEGERRDAVRITFAAWEHERPMYEPLIEEFEEEHPGISVILVPLEDLTNTTDPFSQYELFRQLVTGADTAPSMGITRDISESGLVMNLAPLMDADATFDRDDFYQGTLEYVSTEEGMWVLPRSFYMRTLAYNKDLFAQHNIPTPSYDWTWDDLFAIAEQTTRSQGNMVETYGYLDSSDGFLVLFSLLEAQGIDLLRMSPDEVQLDRPEVIAAVERVKRWYEQGVLLSPYVSPAEGEMDEAALTARQPENMVRAGRVAMWDEELIESRLSSSSASSASPDTGERQTSSSFPFEVGVLPYPTNRSNPLFMGAVHGYIISSGTRHPEAAWQWIEFLSRHPLDTGQPTPAFTNRVVPARPSLAKDIGFWAGMDETRVDAYQWTIAHWPAPIHNFPDAAVTSTMMEVLNNVIRQGQDDVAGVVAEAQQQLEEKRALAQLTPTVVEERGPVVVATPKPDTPPEGTTVLSFLSSDFNAVELRRLAQEFQQHHPDLMVEIETTMMYTQPLSIIDLAQRADCFTTFEPVEDKAQAAALLDLQPLLDADPNLTEDDFFPSVLDSYRRDGKLVGLPLGIGMNLLYHNRAAFETAGIEPPQSGWTPDEFLAAAEALTIGEGNAKRYGYVPLGTPERDLTFFIRQFGGKLFTGTGSTLHPHFDDPAVVEATRWYLDLDRRHGVMPPLRFHYRRSDSYENDYYTLIREGRAAMWLDFGRGILDSSRPEQVAIEPFEPTAGPLPVGGSGLNGRDISFSSSFYLSAETQTPQACWQWVSFLSTQPDLIQSSVPARIAVAQSDDYQQHADPALVSLAAIYEEMLTKTNEAHGGVTPRQEHGELYWFLEAVNDALEGKQSLEQALAEAQETTIAFISCVETHNTPGTCARRVDPQYDGYLEETQQKQPLP
jgi:ABC-type glycerol-3-phosphate transport system substrate-binding protein